MVQNLSGRMCAAQKKERGLGIKHHHLNKACMIRHLWDIARIKDSLWVKSCHMYMLRGKNLWAGVFSGDVSCTWRKLMNLRQLTWRFIQYPIGDGRSTRLWLDYWHPCM